MSIPLTFPFKFQVLLNHQLELIECAKIEIDVSSFYNNFK